MLRIYPVALEMLRDVAVLVDQIAQRDRDLARQLKRSSKSVVLNLQEGTAVRDGRRRVRYGDSLGSARETLAGLEVAEVVGYIKSIDQDLRGRFDHIIGTLVNIIK